MNNDKNSKGFSKNFWILFIMAIILGTAFWSLGGSRVADLAPYYFKKITGDTAEVLINGTTFKVELAKTDSAKQTGLSKRSYLQPQHGMLFMMDNIDYYSFTLKDTEISLDIIWILDGKIVDMSSNVLPGTELVTPINKANYILEIKPGNIAGGGWEIDDPVEINF